MHICILEVSFEIFLTTSFSQNNYDILLDVHTYVRMYIRTLYSLKCVVLLVEHPFSTGLQGTSEKPCMHAYTCKHVQADSMTMYMYNYTYVHTCRTLFFDT